MTVAPCPGASSRTERIISLLRALVRINTEHAVPARDAPYGEGCARALSLVYEECERRGFAVCRLGEKVVCAEVGSAGPLAAFPVHLDVVPAGDGWAHDPYAADLVDGVLYGRGCMDNKIGGAILIELVDELARSWRDRGQELPCRLRIIFGTDEETGMSDLEDYVNSGEELPTLGFVPDAAFPATRGEKARLHLRVCHSVKADGLTIEAGTMVNVVPARAVARLADGTEIRVQGRSAHGSTPERGENAACKLVRELVGRGVTAGGALEEVDRLLCRDLTGAALGVDVPDDTFGHASLNLGVLALANGRLTAELDLRFGMMLSANDVVSRVRQALGEEWSVEVVRAKPLHLVSADDPCLRVLLAAYEEVTGERGAEADVMAGGTYASYLPALVAFGPKLPGTHSGAHGTDEHVSVKNIERAEEIYWRALEGIVALAASREE